MPERQKSSRNAETSSLFTFRITKVSTVTGIGGVLVAKRRTVVTFGLVPGLCVSKVSTVTGGGPGCETQNCRHFWTRLASSRLKSVNSHRGGSWLRNPELSSLLDSSRVFASQKCQQSQGSGGAGRETQNCRHFWTRPGSSRLKSVNSHRDRGVLVAKPRTVVTFGLIPGLRVSKVSAVTGIGGVVVAKPRTVVTFGLVPGLRVSKVSTVTGIGGVLVAKPRTVVTVGLVPGLCVSKVSTVTGGGPGCETQNCRHFWTRPGSSRLKSVNSHRDRGGPGCETQNCRHFWTRLASSRLKSVNSHRGGSWLRNPELSSLLDSFWREEEEKRRVDRRKERGERRQERGGKRERRGQRG